MSNNSYKLIKEYPGSHTLGTIIPKGGMGWFHTYTALENGLYTEFWEKIKEPLFTTEDGVELFEGDNFYTLILEQTGLLQKHSIHSNKCKKDTFKNLYHLKFKIFSTEKAASDWIEMNKPKYSMKDILEMKIWNIKDRHTLELNLPELCKIYKSK